MKKLIVMLALASTAVFAQRMTGAKITEMNAKAEAEAEAKAEAEAETEAKVKAEAIRKANGGSTFTDIRDKKTYKTIKIGKQTWMAENLDYHGEDGYLGLCYGDKPKEKIREPENCKKYGRLYDWNEAKKACPKGWHLPNDKEWQTLIDFAGGKEVAGKKLKSKTDWKEHDFSGESLVAPKCKWTEEIKEEIDNRGRVIAPAWIMEHDKCTTDEFAFSALPGGDCDSGGDFRNIGDIGNWWSDSEYSSSNAYFWYMRYYYESTNRGSYDKGYLYSVRCLEGQAQTTSIKPPSARDIDMGSGDGSRSKAEIMDVVSARMPGLRNTYNHYLEFKPGFSGKVTLKFTIAPGGDIINISIVSSTTGYSEFDNAVKHIVSTWKWKVIKSGNTTQTIPFDFTD
jgi:TonB family protein